ncbi:MAG TPA: hypothetical protein DIT98_07495 [Verrucomicrobiales bacterium]|nr:hypothetical protein [Verrucomicrobiales bacterium]
MEALVDSSSDSKIIKIPRNRQKKHMGSVPTINIFGYFILQDSVSISDRAPTMEKSSQKPRPHLFEIAWKYFIVP